MILLTLLYFSFISGTWNILAFPTNSQLPENLKGNHTQSIFIRGGETRLDATRSMYGILWSCLSTIFACTWIAVHPNIPAPGDSRWAVLRRRVAIMGYILLAPEMVIIWAGRQHYAARNIARKHQENKGWTRAHAFFLIMGGFILHEGGRAVRVLESKDLEELSDAGKIDWPTITEEEIADRSKGDYLSKGIVLFQTTWFIGQVIARGAYRLAITELEVVTLAFAILTGVIYYFWWDKPLDVRCSIPVQLIEGRSGKIRDEKGDAGSQIISFPQIYDKECPQRDDKMDINPLLSTPIQDDNSNPDPALTRTQRLQAFIRRSCVKHGTLLGLGYVFIISPMVHFFGPFIDMFHCETLEDKALRVPTFYSPSDEDDYIALFFGMCVSIVFGAIHCIAWSYHFASSQERWMWRISAILVSGLPIAIIASSTFLTVFENEENSTVWIELYEDVLTVISMAMACLYMIARIALLVLPFVALRALPPDAYVDVDWISFLPHI